MHTVDVGGIANKTSDYLKKKTIMVVSFLQNQKQRKRTHNTYIKKLYFIRFYSSHTSIRVKIVSLNKGKYLFVIYIIHQNTLYTHGINTIIQSDQCKLFFCFIKIFITYFIVRCFIWHDSIIINIILVLVFQGRPG